MHGAIFGDIVGSVYEFNNTHDYDFELLSRKSRPTDDSYMTVAVAIVLMEMHDKDDDGTKGLFRQAESSGNAVGAPISAVIRQGLSY